MGTCDFHLFGHHPQNDIIYRVNSVLKSIAATLMPKERIYTWDPYKLYKQIAGDIRGCKDNEYNDVPQDQPREQVSLNRAISLLDAHGRNDTEKHVSG